MKVTKYTRWLIHWDLERDCKFWRKKCDLSWSHHSFFPYLLSLGASKCNVACCIAQCPIWHINVANSLKFSKFLLRWKVDFFSQRGYRGAKHVHYLYYQSSRTRIHEEIVAFCIISRKKDFLLEQARNSQILRTQLFGDIPMSNLCNFDQRIQICCWFLLEMPQNA